MYKLSETLLAIFLGFLPTHFAANPCFFVVHRCERSLLESMSEILDHPTNLK